MKKTAIALAVAIASISSAAYAVQPSKTFYVGGKVGWSKFHRTSMPDFDKAKNGIGGGLFVGYQANPFLAFEVGYDYIGRGKMESQTGADDNKFTVHGASFTGKFSLPFSLINDNFDIYARGGVLINHNKFKGNGIDEGYWAASPLWGGGVEYQFTDRWSARLDYQWVNHIQNNGPSGFSPDNSLLSLGVTYNLGGPGAGAAVEVNYNEKHYVLNEDVLFSYADSTLSKDGKKALRALLKNLKHIDPGKSRIVVVGHTDRIGSASFNKRLSEQRARSVMDYLVLKGVPGNVISARGEGKARPVTGASCNRLNGSALKSCLAPDRRVEIDVRAINVTQSIR